MKLNYRIIFINFSILAMILTGAGIAFYSIMNNVLTTQESKRLRDAANDLAIVFESVNSGCEESFQSILPSILKSNRELQVTDELKNLDFVLRVERGGGAGENMLLLKGRSIRTPKNEFTVRDFFVLNQNLIVKSYKSKAGIEYLYGFSIEKEFLQTLSTRMRTDFAFYFDSDRMMVTNQGMHESYLPLLDGAYRQLFMKSNYELFSVESDNQFVLATIYHIKEATSNSKSASILIFSTIREAGGLVSTLRLLLAVIAIASLILSVILNFIFTAKIRRQVNSLTKATEIAKTGNFHNRISITTNDEIGQLAAAFNIMLNELEAQERIKQDYTEFITQINRSADFKKIAKDSLQRIIKSTEYSIGAIYLVNNDKIELVMTEGLDPSHLIFSDKNDLLYSVLNSNQKIELKFSQGAPAINAGLVSIHLTEMVILPVASGNTIVAILQLAAVDPVNEETKQYLDKVMDQLAIALNKALVYKRLQELVVELEIQKSKAEESTELKSKFLAIMSHELRTPLNAILGLAQLLSEDQTLTPRNRERLHVLMTSGKRLLQMINDVLDLSKFEAGRMDSREEEFNLWELIQELQTAFQPMMSSKGLDFRVNYLIPEKIYIRTDKTKLYQILNNLLSNAVKFTHKGYVELTAQIDSKDTLYFTVVDSGIGISKEDIPFIFEEFRQADSSSTRKYGGSGLGLSIAKKFAELLGGSLAVKSESEQGSTFIVELAARIVKPRIEHIEPYPEKTSSKESAGETPAVFAQIKEKAVLIVDDDPESLFTINEIVKECGYRTIIAKNGNECLEILHSVVPHLILMDLMMPGMDGFQTTKSIRSNAAWAAIPIIAVSARSVLEEQKQLLQEGFNGVIPKPVNAANLAFKITQLITNQQIADADNTPR
jgi:signal transduction histidine kinase/ActR/RegA family two-component response regulator/HAMP domain-containing protein